MCCTVASPSDSWALGNQSRTPLLVSSRFRTTGTQNNCPAAAPVRGCRFVSVWCLSWWRRSTARLPACLLDEYHLTSCVGVRSRRSTDSRTCVDRRAHNGYGCFAVAFHIVCGTVCCCSCENRTFRLTKNVLKLYWRRFCSRWLNGGALRLIVKSAVYAY